MSDRAAHGVVADVQMDAARGLVVTQEACLAHRRNGFLHRRSRPRIASEAIQEDSCL